MTPEERAKSDAEQAELQRLDRIQREGGDFSEEERERRHQFCIEMMNTPKPHRISIPSWESDNDEGADNRAEEEYKRNHQSL